MSAQAPERVTTEGIRPGPGADAPPGIGHLALVVGKGVRAVEGRQRHDMINPGGYDNRAVKVIGSTLPETPIHQTLRKMGMRIPFSREEKTWNTGD